jgi:hypothetical protein
VLAVDMTTGQQLAIKFISRGRQHVDVNMKEISRELLVSRVCSPCSCRVLRGHACTPPSPRRGAACWLSTHAAVWAVATCARLQLTVWC